MSVDVDSTLVGEAITGVVRGCVPSIPGETVADELGAAEQCEHERMRNKHRTKGWDWFILCAIIKPVKGQESLNHPLCLTGFLSNHGTNLEP